MMTAIKTVDDKYMIWDTKTLMAVIVGTQVSKHLMEIKSKLIFEIHFLIRFPGRRGLLFVEEVTISLSQL